MTRVLIALTSHEKLGETGRTTGFHAGEAAEPWTAFRAAGFEVTLVSPQGGRPPVDGRDETDATQNAFFAEAPVDRTLRPEEVDADAYDAIFFAGGHGVMWDFPDDAGLAGLAARIYDRGGVVAAVCHGPAALVNLTLADGTRLVDGKRVAAFTNAEEEAIGLTGVVPFLLADALTAAGATHLPGPEWTAQVAVDGRLVTGQNPQSARGVADEVVKLLS